MKVHLVHDTHVAFLNALCRNLESPDIPVFSADAHKEIINCIDGVGGLGIGEGAPEIVTGSRDGKWNEIYEKLHFPNRILASKLMKCIHLKYFYLFYCPIYFTTLYCDSLKMSFFGSKKFMGKWDSKRPKS